MPKIESKKRSKEDPPDVRRAAARQHQEEAELYAAAFKALGDPTRLRIVLFLRDALVSAGIAPVGAARPASMTETAEEEEAEGDTSLPGSLTVGEIAEHLTGSDKVSSNVSHHLKELRHAGLIGMKRRGKHVFCRVEEEALLVLARLLVEPRK